MAGRFQGAGASGAADEALAADRERDVPDAADKTVATVLGEIVWLMSQSPE